MKTIKTSIIHLGLSGILGLAGVSAALAQQYPTRAISLIVVAAPGGLSDAVGRVVGERLSKRLGQTVLIENRGGAGGAIAMAAAARGEPDGHTLIIANQALTSVNPSLYNKMPYDLAGFVPVSDVGSYSAALAVDRRLGANTLKAFIDLARAKPKSLTYGSVGIGTTSHLEWERFARRAGLDVTSVPYKGEAPALTDVAGGQISAVMVTLAVVRPLHNGGQVRVLAVGSAARSPLLPDVPTFEEAGLPGFQAGAWYCLLAPKGTPAPVVERLSREMIALLAEDDTRARMTALGVDAAGSSPEALAAKIRDETEKWRKVIAEANIPKLD